MKRPACMLAFLTVFGGVVLASTASAQEPPSNLPFTNIYKRPAVSPYTMLGNSQGMGGGEINAMTGAAQPLVYQQLVQPRLEQERQQTTMLRQNRQIGILQNQVQSIQRDTSMRQVDRSIRPTGHASTYMNTSHYFGNRAAGNRR